MATFHSMSKAHAGRHSSAKSRAARLKVSALHTTGATHRGDVEGPRRLGATAQNATKRIRGAFHDFLVAEQGFLTKTESLLLCIAKSMDTDEDSSTAPYYPDVLEFASELVKRRAVAIDALLLDGRIPQNAVGRRVDR